MRYLKRACLFVIFILCIVNLSGKRFYFDTGFGFSIDKSLSLYGKSYNQYKSSDDFGLDFGARLGYLLSKRSILVLDYQRIYNGEYEEYFGINMLPFESWLRQTVNTTYTGIGFICYLTSRLQFGLTVGLSITTIDIEHKITDYYNYGPYRHVANGREVGYGYDISVAYDIPIGRLGTLIGARLFSAANYDESDTSFLFDTTSLGLFLRVRY